MLTHTIAVVIGALVGWNLPQPQWAKTLSTKIVEWFEKKTS